MTLPLADLERLRALAPAADQAGHLLPEQVALIHRAGWLRMLAPRALGGDERPLPEVVRLEEALSHADGSCGWVVTLCAGAGWFGGFLDPALGREVFATPRLCLAGSGAPTGVADRDGDGWCLNGHWAHASGAPLATHFTLNARLREAGRPLLDAQGQPRVRAFIVPAAEVQVDAQSWHSIGLRASASCAFTLTDVRVPAHHAFDLVPGGATVDGPLYRFPFEALALATLAACVAGMARRFVELAEPLALRPLPRLGGPSAAAATTYAQASAALATARGAFFAELDRAWPDAADAAPLAEAAHALVRTAREAVDRLYPCCGLQAADPRSDINRVWRDLHTATQHAIWLR